MNNFRRHALLAITVLTLGAGSLAAHANDPRANEQMSPKAMSTEDRAKFHERMKERVARRQAALHDKLNLTSAQEPAWKTFVEKTAMTNPSARPNRSDMAKMSAPERMERQLAMMKEAEKRMADRLVSVKQFYAVLTPAQQKTFNDEYAKGRHHRRS